jgi:Ca2+/Na+ antiporter
MFLCYWVDYGLIGLGFICFAFTYPVFREKKQKSFLLLIFLFIVLLSCLNEDTLANHDGITFFATLYAVFLFADYEQSDQLSTDDKPAY